MATTHPTDDELRRAAKERIASLLKVSSDGISPDAAFGEDIKASYVSDWKQNELDLLLEDIRDVADGKALDELNSGATVIKTVGDYCEFMVRCYRTRPEEVVRVLFS